MGPGTNCLFHPGDGWALGPPPFNYGALGVVALILTNSCESSHQLIILPRSQMHKITSQFLQRHVNRGTECSEFTEIHYIELHIIIIYVSKCGY